MKRTILILISALVVCLSYAADIGTKSAKTAKNPNLQGSLTVTCSPDLLSLTQRWAGEFTRNNPGVKLNVMKVSPGARNYLSDPGTDLAIISADYSAEPGNISPWKMAVGRDIVVPVISSSNPYAGKINQEGMTPEEIAGLILSTQSLTWESLIKGTGNNTADFYVVDDPAVKSALARYLGLDIKALAGVKAISATEMLSILSKDRYAIVFCHLTDILIDGREQVAGTVSLLPIDKNSNGKLDSAEGIYANLPSLLRGVWIGKYPKALARNVYAYSSLTPTNQAGIAFLRYIIGDGQVAVDQSGLISLVPGERISKSGMLPEAPVNTTAKALNPWQLIITLAFSLLVILVIVTWVLRFRRNLRPVHLITPVVPTGTFNESWIVVPKGLFFDKSHTWAFMEASGIVKVGIDDFLQHVTGPLTRIRMKKPGEKITKGDPILTFIQKGKQLTISSPVSGVIKAENTLLFTDPSFLNSSPLGDGWVYQIEPTNWQRETQLLFMADKYTEWIKGEFSRLRDFLSMTIKPEMPEYSYAILQDGGEITNHVLAQMGPEVWEDFQVRFIDNANQPNT